ncbi:hypothetical protein [Natronorubrum sp. FCH18a]|uniref:hypothetical protein n=1 Tax=Natronorubrum sp. FCH18a TaxID=3447018 RepID=UPI003F511276
MTISSTSSPIRYRIQSADTLSEHDLIGEEILVPQIDASSDEASVEHTTGIITKVHTLSSDSPDILSTYIEEKDKVVHIDLTAGPIA